MRSNDDTDVISSPSQSKEKRRVNGKKFPSARVVDDRLTTAHEQGSYFDGARDKGAHRSYQRGLVAGEALVPRRLTLIEELAERVGVEDNNKIFETLVNAAKTDWQAALFFMERFYPKGKYPRKIYSSIRDLITLHDIDAAQTQIIKETAAGDLDIDDANVLFQMTVKKSDFQVRNTTEEMKQLIEELKVKQR